MNKKIIYITGSITIIAILVITGVFLIKQKTDSKGTTNEIIKETVNPPKQEKLESSKDTKVYDVEDVVQKPEQYTGKIGVSGKVIKNDSKKMMLTLGCEDACILMPVRYSAENKFSGSDKNITAIGEIKQENGKYYFDAVDIKEK